MPLSSIYIRTQPDPHQQALTRPKRKIRYKEVIWYTGIIDSYIKFEK